MMIRSEHPTQTVGVRAAIGPRSGKIKRRGGLTGVALVALLAIGGCVIPVDTGANAAAMALDEMNALAYTMRDETALLQAQIDSLASQLRKTDSLLRWIANLTGNPIVDMPQYFPPPPTGGGVVDTIGAVVR